MNEVLAWFEFVISLIVVLILTFVVACSNNERMINIGIGDCLINPDLEKWDIQIVDYNKVIEVGHKSYHMVYITNIKQIHYFNIKFSDIKYDYIKVSCPKELENAK